MNKKLGEKIKKLRISNNISQEKLSKLLGVSRPTLSQIETGERALKTIELQKIAEIFEISPLELLDKKIEKKVKNKDELEIDPFIKFKQTLLYILNKCGQKPNVGKIVINKLLYFADFNYYEKTGNSITGVDYIKLPRGPVPKIMDLILSEMEKEQSIKQFEVEYYNYKQHRIIPLTTPNINNFKTDEIQELDYVINNYSDKNAEWLSTFSHNDIPYKATENIGETISYGLVFYRDNIYSVKQEENN